MSHKLEGAEAQLVNILVCVGRAKGNWDILITDALNILKSERLRAANEVRRILRQEIEDANKRIAANETNPLYWLARRFDQLADEIQDNDYAE